MILCNKVALVTGSSRGIGWACASIMAKHGARVILNGAKDESLLHQRAEEINKDTGVEAGVLMYDVSDPEQVRHAYSEISKKYQRLDILVNNAGILEDNLIGMISHESIRRVLSVNVEGVILNIQYAARLMARQKSGTIVNISSIIGRFGNAGQVLYGGSKAAVIGITQSAAKELVCNGIRVNAIAPGFIDTDMVRCLPKDKFNERMDSIKMGRIGTPTDIANSVLFFASDFSAYVTGQVLGVDGGMLI